MTMPSFASEQQKLAPELTDTRNCWIWLQIHNSRGNVEIVDANSDKFDCII